MRWWALILPVAAVLASGQARADWDGPYAGLGLGAIWTEGTASAAADELTSDAIVAGFIGYNFSQDGVMVLGGEADIASDSLDTGDYVFSARLRGGMQIMDGMGMAYLTGGFAGIQADGTDVGAITGLGYEHALNGGLMLRFEYLYSVIDTPGEGLETETLRAGVLCSF